LTVFSLIAIVPESEFSKPTLMESPEVTTQDSAAVLSPSLVLLPQADNTKPQVIIAAAGASARVRYGFTGWPFFVHQAELRLYTGLYTGLRARTYEADVSEARGSV